MLSIYLGPLSRDNIYDFPAGTILEGWSKACRVEVMHQKGLLFPLHCAPLHLSQIFTYGYRDANWLLLLAGLDGHWEELSHESITSSPLFEILVVTYLFSHFPRHPIAIYIHWCWQSPRSYKNISHGSEPRHLWYYEHLSKSNTSNISNIKACYLEVDTTSNGRSTERLCSSILGN